MVAASVSSRRGGCRNPFAGGHPPVPGLHLQPEPVVIHTQIAVAAAHDSIGHDRFDLLRHHADIRLVPPAVAEAIEAEAAVETAEQDDVVLRPDVGHAHPDHSAATHPATTHAAVAHATTTPPATAHAPT